MAKHPAKAGLGKIIEKVLDRPDVPISGVAVIAATTDKIADAIDVAVADQGLAVVPVTSGWKSKINWTAVPAAIVALGAVFFFDLSVDELKAMLGSAGGLFAAIGVLRTWFNGSVSASSLPAAPTMIR